MKLKKKIQDISILKTKKLLSAWGKVIEKFKMAAEMNCVSTKNSFLRRSPKKFIQNVDDMRNGNKIYFIAFPCLPKSGRTLKSVRRYEIYL
jgi:hypothetical protein